jgi:hypothetical protein
MLSFCLHLKNENKIYSLAMLYLSSILPSTELHFVGILEAIYRLKFLSCRFDFYQQLKDLHQGPGGFGSKNNNYITDSFSKRANCHLLIETCVA